MIILKRVDGPPIPIKEVSNIKHTLKSFNGHTTYSYIIC